MVDQPSKRPFGRGRRMVRAGGLLLIAGVILALLVLLTLPLWFPWVLRPVLSKQGLVYDTYLRKGWTRFELKGVEFNSDSVKVTVSSLTAPLPHVWLPHAAIPRLPVPHVRASDWHVQIVPSGEPAPPVHRSYTQARDALLWLSGFLPSAEAWGGSVESGTLRLQVPQARWIRGRLDGTLAASNGLAALAHLTVRRKKHQELRLDSESLRLTSLTRFEAEDSGLRIRTEGRWATNPFILQAVFGTNDTLPKQAELRAPKVAIPADLLVVPGYRELTAGVVARWEKDRYTVDVEANGQPEEGGRGLPGLVARLRGQGRFENFELHEWELAGPGLRAELRSPVTIHFRDPVLRETAEVSLLSDLAQWPQAGLEGNLTGHVELTPAQESTYPGALINVSLHGLRVRGLEAGDGRLRAFLQWPQFTLTELEFGRDDGSRAELTARLNLQEQTIDDSRVQLGGSWLAQALPPWLRCREIRLEVMARGPIRAPAHQGELQATGVSGDSLNPTDLQVTWQGQALDFEKIHLLAEAQDTSLHLRGGLRLADKMVRGRLRELALERKGLRLDLAEGCPFWAQVPAAGGSDVALGFGELRLAGTGGQLLASAGVHWPANGSLRVAAETLRAELLGGLFPAANLPVAVDALKLDAEWTNSPVFASYNVHATWLTNGNPSLRVHGTCDAEGVTFEQLHLLTEGNVLFHAEGRFPITVRPGREPTIHFDPQGPLRAAAETQTHSLLGTYLGKWLGVEVREPWLSAELNGTWSEPAGQVHLRAAAIELPSSTTNAADLLTGLDLNLGFDRSAARLEQGTVHVRGQPVQLDARLPWPGEFGHTFRWQEQLANLEARLRIQQLPLANLVELAPDFMAPRGRLDADLRLLPGGKLNGAVEVADAGTRTLPGLGPVSDISLQIRIVDNVAAITESGGLVAGSPVRLNGQIDLRPLDLSRTFQTPPFSVALQGKQLPLVRQPEIIIRGDVNLLLFSTNGESSHVVGTVRLRDSSFYSNLADLLPRGGTGPKQRLPYFSVDTPWLRDWSLGIEVVGDRFLRVRSTLFNGELSAQVRLQGTLHEPVAVGAVTADSGRVRFPFGSLGVRQARVWTSSENPFRPRLNVQAASQQYGYDLRMEVTGHVDAPVIQFSSTPPLGSEQIVLLLTAGELPGRDQALSSQQRAQTAAMFLGKELLARLGFSEMGAERVVLRSGEELTESGRPTYSVELKLDEDWSVVAEYDRFGDFNVGGKWRFYSR